MEQAGNRDCRVSTLARLYCTHHQALVIKYLIKQAHSESASIVIACKRELPWLLMCLQQLGWPVMPVELTSHVSQIHYLLWQVAAFLL